MTTADVHGRPSMAVLFVGFVLLAYGPVALINLPLFNKLLETPDGSVLALPVWLPVWVLEDNLWRMMVGYGVDLAPIAGGATMGVLFLMAWAGHYRAEIGYSLLALIGAGSFVHAILIRVYLHAVTSGFTSL